MKKLLPWIGIGLVIRLLLMATVIHPDIRGHNLAAYLISQKGRLFTFYDYLRQLPRDNRLVQVYGDGLFIYPPLAYWTHAVFMAVLGPIYPWGTFERLIGDMGTLKLFPDGLPQLLVLLKLPYLVADALGLWLVLKIVDKRHQFLAGLLWIFNPVTIYASYLLAQFDIYIAVLILAAVVLALRGRQSWAAVVLGLAAGFKPFPLLLAPFLGKGWRQKVQLTTVTILTYGVIVAPYIGSVGFKHYALFASQAEKPLYAKILVSGSQYLPLFIVGLVILGWWNWHRPADLPVWGWMAAILLLFYSLTHFHPQWFTWISPLIILGVIFKPRVRLPAVVILIAYLAIVFSFDSSLNFGLVGSNVSLLKFLTDQNVSLVRGVLAATAVSFVWQLRQS